MTTFYIENKLKTSSLFMKSHSNIPLFSWIDDIISIGGLLPAKYAPFFIITKLGNLSIKLNDFELI
jgi:hypothetical protein